MIILQKLSSRLAVAIVSCCFFPVSSWAADDAAWVRAIVDKAIRPLMLKYDVPGVAVAVTINNRSYFINYGVALRERTGAVTENTLFEIGSVSRIFTATLASYAQVQGMLSLQDHPSQYLPQLKNSAIDEATLLELGTYSAGGLPLQVPGDISNTQQAMDYFQTWKPDAEPGVVRRYSNPSIGLFRHITAIAMKSDFAAAAEGILFPKLGLHHTYVHVPASAQASYAWGHNKSNKAICVNPGVFDAEAYGVKSSAADLLRFVQINIGPRQLAGPMRSAIDATHVGYFEVGAMVQGLGWNNIPTRSASSACSMAIRNPC